MMNCEQAQDMMIAWVYDELPTDQIPDIQAHLATCDACRAELADLRAARAAIAGALAREPAVPIADLPTRRKPIRWRRILAPLAAAAALVVGIMLLLEIGTGPVVAAIGPPIIERTDISLTVLSQPEGWQDAVGQPKARLYYRPTWRGLAMVRDRRLIRRLPEGVSRISFADVPADIRPDSVRLRSLTRPGGLCVLEQNYQYDLATADAVLKRYIDRDVTALAKDANADPVTGVLLSFDRRSLVIRPAGTGPRTLARAELQSIHLAKLPDGLRSTPTLQWELENRDESRQNFEVAYLTEGLSWRADYVLKLARLDISADANEDGGIPAILDAADLVGYATVKNHSGVTFKNAQLKLLAGDVNLIPPDFVSPVVGYIEKVAEDESAEACSPTMTEKAFFEHHLYTVSRPTTLRDRETKQIEMVSGQDVSLTRGYVYTAGHKINAPRVVSEMVNSEANGLGKPLPKGVMRLYAPGPDGETTYVAQTTIDHTPRDEKLRLQWGHAFDIACSAIQTNQRRNGYDHTHTCRVDIRNHKDRDVTVTVRVRVPASTYRFECKDFDWHVREVGIVEISVPAVAGHPVSASYTFQYNPRSGGGLKSPHDQ